MRMDEGMFHFVEPGWLWLLGLVPVWLAWRWWRGRQNGGVAERDAVTFADPELLPYLLVGEATKAPADEKAGWKRRWFGAAYGLVWVLAVVALAGPRWDYTEQRFFQANAAVMVVLDLSRSMNAVDVVPSRMARARAQLGALVDEAAHYGVKVGVIGFAGLPVLVSPLTDDHAALRALLPSLDTSLVALQGSDPTEAFLLGVRQLRAYAKGQGGRHLHLLLVTDGDVDNPKLLDQWLKDLEPGEGEARVVVHALQVATEAGAPVPDDQGYSLTGVGGGVHVSKPDVALLEGIAGKTGGIYAEAGLGDAQAKAVLAAMMAGDGASGEGMEEMLEEKSGLYREWVERYGWFLLPAMLLMLVFVP